MNVDSTDTSSIGENSAHTAQTKRNSPKGPKTDSVQETSEKETSDRRSNRAAEHRSIEQQYLDSTDKDDNENTEVAKSTDNPESREKMKNFKSMEKIKNFKFSSKYPTHTPERLKIPLFQNMSQFLQLKG
ncbi:unnamed protein product [Psylliodes chrysocephalus]|uniref:Uncharacterized protein n=1 Tax=Psylliodes chrysocephalus TaxID=3402493 RepID=A0A9P0D1W0_9CUCU|nr:unnamed protein product [Psylliodes chrysocephala]